MEGDSLTIIKKATSYDADRSEISPYIEDIRRILKGFQRCTFVHTLRSANGAANSLAKEGLKLGIEFFDQHRVPNFAESIVNDDRRWVKAPD